ncbi:unnamed protein product, partial [Closterium sp. NIES-54]
ITTFNTFHDSKPPNARRPRLDFAMGSWDILPLTPARPKSGHVKCLVRHVIELCTVPSLSSSPSRHSDGLAPPTPSKRSVSPAPSHLYSASTSSPVHSSLPGAVAGVAKAAAGKPISFIKGLMREKKEKERELQKSASVAVAGGVGGVEVVEEEVDGHVAFEEFADSFPYASLCRIAGGGGGGGGEVGRWEVELDGHVAFEELADSFPYASLCRIAGMGWGGGGLVWCGVVQCTVVRKGHSLFCFHGRRMGRWCMWRL